MSNSSPKNITELSLFYNHSAFNDVLILVADESAIPDVVEEYENVIVLKEKDRIIGINIFNSLDFVKLKANGLVYSVNEALANCLEVIIKDYTGYDVKIVENTYILGKIVDIHKDKYLVEIGCDLPVLACSSLNNLNLGDYVEVVYKETRLKTGHKAYHYLKGKADYFITANNLQKDKCGTILYKTDVRRDIC